MPEPIGFRCDDCGYGFIEAVLTDAEKVDLKRKNQSWSALRCPKCNSIKVSRV